MTDYPTVTVAAAAAHARAHPTPETVIAELLDEPTPEDYR